MGSRIKRVVAVGLMLGTGLLSGDARARQEALLQISAGHLPTDTGSDTVNYKVEESTELGGKALRVALPNGDSFGDRVARIKNWKEFIALQFDAVNPSQDKVHLTLTVKHKRTTSFQTRVDAPFVLQPGKNSIKLGIDELVNVNGSAPDLANVVRWYIAGEPGKTTTALIGDLWLVGDDLPATPRGGADAAVAGPARAYRIKGMVGGMAVDLKMAPEGEDGAGGASGTGTGQGRGGRVQPVHDDPARLARIRAAKMPAITAPVLFNTPEADAILSALEVYPPDNAWNLVVEDWPLHANSKNLVASVGVDKPLRYNPDMGFVLVPPDQKRVEVKIVGYPGESDPGPFPVPDNTPIEGWPGVDAPGSDAGKVTLDEVQRDKLNKGGDRHGIVVDPVNRMLYEFYQLKKTDAGWEAAQSSVFDLKTNKLRPDGWTSSDAAGLPIFPAVVRHDELQRGEIEHALRVTIRKTRRAYVAPATHFASRLEDENLPRMGERFRLKKDYDISGFSPAVQTVLKALKKYGMFVADNGIEWAISVAPDPRIPVLHEELRRVKGSAFEVVVPPGTR